MDKEQKPLPVRAVEAVVDFGKGLATTLKSMFEKPVTYQYPEVKRPVRPRFRGRHVLKRYDDGLERCIGCSLCAASCPADAIFVEAAENTDERRFSPGERYASTYEINYIRCIFCGYCEDACPTNAIVLDDDYELSFMNRTSSIYPKELLLEAVPPGVPTTPQQTEPGKFNWSIPEMPDVRFEALRLPSTPEVEERK